MLDPYIAVAANGDFHFTEALLNRLTPELKHRLEALQGIERERFVGLMQKRQSDAVLAQVGTGAVDFISSEYKGDVARMTKEVLDEIEANRGRVGLDYQNLPVGDSTILALRRLGHDAPGHYYVAWKALLEVCEQFGARPSWATERLVIWLHHRLRDHGLLVESQGKGGMQFFYQTYEELMAVLRENGLPPNTDPRSAPMWLKSRLTSGKTS